MNIVVLAYQEIGYVALEALLSAGANVVGLFTHQDDPGEEIWFRSVAALAESGGIPVHRPPDPNAPEVIRLIRSLEPDIIFSFYYRHVLSDELLALPRTGAYNLHGSLLPRYRGRAPVNWVLVNGETETGVTLHRMVRRPDAGPVVAQRAVPIAETDTVRELYAKMVEASGRMMAEVWPAMAVGDFIEVPQDESRATCFGRRGPEDGRIDWRQPAKRIYDLCRAVTHPYPGAFTDPDGRRLFIWDSEYDPHETQDGLRPGTVSGTDVRGIVVAAGQGTLFIRAAQWQGRPEMAGPDLPGLGLVDGMSLS